jgi:glycosyltransferase involved in cell wall biosynthesis
MRRGGVELGVSLIVATIGRPLELDRLLHSLCLESIDEKQVIIVNQAPADVRQAVWEVVDRYSSLLKIEYVVDNGRGLSRARNRGLSLATMDIVAFPDDDCWYSGAVLSTVLRKFEADDRLGIAVGPYSEPGVENPAFPRDLLRLSASNFFGKTSSVGLFFRLSRLAGAAFLFDETIGAGTKLPVGEETDLIMRLLTKGVKAEFDPSILVFHKIERLNIISVETAVSHRRAFWYVIGKNYQLGFSEFKLLKGLVSIVVRSSHVIQHCKAAINGYRLGRAHTLISKCNE